MKKLTRPRLVIALAAMIVFTGNLMIHAQKSDTMEMRSKGENSTFAKRKQNPVEASKSARIDLDTWHSKLKKAITDFDELYKKLDLKEIRSKQIAVAELQKIIEQLQDASTAILGGYDSFNTSFNLYLQAVGRAPSTFDELAKHYELKAANITNPLLKQEYADLALRSKKMAKIYTDQEKSLHAVRKEIEEKLEFVEESSVFLCKQQPENVARGGRWKKS